MRPANSLLTNSPLRYHFVLRSILLLIILSALATATMSQSAQAVYQPAPLIGTFTPEAITDQNSTVPLSNPIPTGYAPRYLSGFGTGNSFTVFFEDRNLAQRISYVQTTTGPNGFPAAPIATNITDTHFVVKDWPYPDTGPVQYQYRAWGSAGNNPDHHFYGSNDLTNWTLLSTFQIANDPGFTTARGTVYYGFHDVIRIPQSAGPSAYHYYAWGESNQGQTILVTSDGGGGLWSGISSIGGSNPADLPLVYPESATPTGSFFDLGHDRGYGKLFARGDDSGLYLAVNTEAKASLSPALFEAAFINPANWAWHDGTTGLMSTPLLTASPEHDYREVWLVPNSAPDDPWIGIYTADYGTADGGLALGDSTITPEAFIDGTINTTEQAGALPATGFPKNWHVKGIHEPAGMALSADSDLTLEIPDLGVGMEIVGVPLKNGDWDVSWLGSKAGYLYGTAFPTWEGNTVITGHIWDENNQPGPFAQVKQLGYGDKVLIHAWGLTYTYEVRESHLTLPQRVENTIQHEEYDWVTLLTCEFYNPFNENYVFRRVVRAVLVDISPQQ